MAAMRRKGLEHGPLAGRLRRNAAAWASAVPAPREGGGHRAGFSGPVHAGAWPRL